MRGVTVLAILLAACETGGPGASPSPSTDTTNVLVGSAPPQAWTVLPEPHLILGRGGAGDPTFHRIDQVLTLDDGSLMVADRGDLRLHRYAPDGTLLWTMGRPGFGPGEFRTFAGVVSLDEDRLLILDPAMPRFTTLRVTGEVVESHAVEMPGETGAPLDVLRLEGALGHDRVLLVPRGVVIRRRAAPGSFSEEFPLVVYRRNGEFVGPFGPRWTMEMWGDGRGSTAIPFGRRTLTAVQGDSILVADTQRGEIDVWDGSRHPVRTIVLPGTPPPLEEHTARSWIETRTEGIAKAADRRSERRWLEQLPFPERFPYMQGLKVDWEGRLWLRSVRRPGESGPAVWTVLDTHGTRLARVETPSRLGIQEIHQDRVVGIWTDSLGVQTVRVYELRGPA